MSHANCTQKWLFEFEFNRSFFGCCQTLAHFVYTFHFCLFLYHCFTWKSRLKKSNRVRKYKSYPVRAILRKATWKKARQTNGTAYSDNENSCKQEIKASMACLTMTITVIERNNQFGVSVFWFHWPLWLHGRTFTVKSVSAFIIVK